MKKICLILVFPALVSLTFLGAVKVGQAQTSALRIVERNAAINTTTNLQVWRGRASVIDFTQTGEVVTYIRLADPSKVVLNTDAQLKSNQARMIFVQPIQTLRFPGAITTPITNLFVKTRSSEGVERLYTFNIVHCSGKPTNNGVAISSVTANREQNIFLANNQTVFLADVERGLEVAIRRGYTTANDPVIFKVREFLALVRNGTTIARSVERTNLSMSVIISLAKLGMGDIHQLNQLILN
ncbi:hypothetical protein ACE1CI_19490 [Aerosakkonemataceae cyanobacterium BLCC-F50]|uniref:Uncharacterized protein n=1 Tax=Floridaenema flaviceps BLCC-F50 TaxID=3153642 RepID=A0ABV4XTU9_9CYAN